MPRPILVSEDRIEQAITEAIDYIASRQCRNGGFCFYRTEDVEESNLRDTYYAVAAYDLVQRAVPHHDQLVDYLRSMSLHSRQASYLYYSAFTAYRLDEPVLNRGLLDRLAGLQITPPNGRNVPLSDWLESSLKIIRLQKTFAGYSTMNEIRDFVYHLARLGGVGGKPNLIDTYRALSILAELNSLAGLDDTRDFIDRLQCASFGFRYTEDSLSPANIDTLYAGVFSCALLGLNVRYPADIVSSILVSQRVHGGFGRSPASLGDLNTNYKALRIIHRLRPGRQTPS